MLLAVAMGLASPHVSDAAVPRNHQVWFAPASGSPDLIQMFTRPDLWADARSKIQVFEIGPMLAGGMNWGTNTLADMTKVGAYRLLRKWGIDLAIESPAIKPWGCSGQKDIERTLHYISTVQRAGGFVKYIAMDEPLAAAIRRCKMTPDQAADVVASYIKTLRASDPALIVGDIIAYPYFNVSDIRSWVQRLEQRGAKPSFLHLDANIHFLDVHPQINYASDLRDIETFIESQGIAFGVIFWPGYNPVSSDVSYYNRVMSWVRRVHGAIGAPDDVIFESWVIRSSLTCRDPSRACTVRNLRCNPTDPIGCGQKSVPVNLPDDDPQVFSHTRLINDALSALNW